jgi:two-component system cell cycle sensor histidine kinase/response regulator CckA
MAALKSTTILLADDEPAIRSLIETALTAEGYRVLPAKNGYEALRVFNEHGAHIDLVITDMRMPYIGGMELIAALLARRSTLKCLGISGYPVAADAGVRVLPKPFSRKELLQTVQQVLAA